MLVYAITWILCDVSLVEVQLAGWSRSVGFLITLFLCLCSIVWQIKGKKKPALKTVLLTSCIGGFALWQVSALPVSISPENLSGEWIGQWEGLPNRSSAQFRPIQRISDSDVSPDSLTMLCGADRESFRFWVRGIKAVHHQEEAVKPGLCVRVSLQSDESGKPLPPGIESWRQRNRIVGTMRLVKGSSIEILNAHTDPVDTLRLKIRENFERDDVEASFRLSFLKKMPVLLALVTGDRALMRPSHWQLFADTGTSHLMAISGSHVSMFAMLVYWWVRRVVSLSVTLTRHWPAQYIAAVAGFGGAFGYALLAGFNVPTQRTLVMIGVAVLLKLRGRSLLSWDAWWIALTCVLLYDPLAVIDRGAWLSFFAVALILWVLQGRLRPLGAISGWFAVQFAIFVGLAPLLGYAFGGFPLISPVANAFAIPLTCFVVVPGALIYAALAPNLPWLADLMLTPLLWVTDLMFWFLQWAAKMGGAGYRVPPMGAAVTLMGLLGALWCMAPKGFPGKAIATAFMLPSLLGPGFFPQLFGAEYWLPTLRQSVVVDEKDALWWVFEAGNASMQRQAALNTFLREKGYGYAWAFQEERYSDWIKTGFLIHRYPKKTDLPGQVILGAPALYVPCSSTATELHINTAVVASLAPSERECWLRFKAPQRSILMAGELKHSTQLAMAATSHESQLDSSSDPALQLHTLLLTPRSQTRLTGAVLERFAPQQVVEWPAKSSLFPEAQPKLEARNISRTNFDAFVAQRKIVQRKPNISNSD